MVILGPLSGFSNPEDTRDSVVATCCRCGDRVNNSGLMPDEAMAIKEAELMDEWICFACEIEENQGKRPAYAHHDNPDTEVGEGDPLDALSDLGGFDDQ